MIEVKKALSILKNRAIIPGDRVIIDLLELYGSGEKLLISFAQWLEKEGYKAIGYNMWQTTKWSRWDEPMYETTEQLVNKFIKESKL